MKKKRLSGEKSFLLLKTPPKLNYSSSLEYKNFRSFLKDIEDVLLTKDEKIIKEIKEKINIKIPKLYSLNQFEKVYRKTFFKKRRKKEKHDFIKNIEKWRRNEIILFVWAICEYSALHNKLVDTYTNEDWSFIARLFPECKAEKCQFKWFSIQKCTSQKSSWSKQEDQNLKEIVEKHRIMYNNPKSFKWTEISAELNHLLSLNPIRLGKHCRERWFNYLDPNLSKNPWSKEEDWLLLNEALRNGKKWALISKNIVGRNENSVKNRWFSLLKLYKDQIQDPENILEIIEVFKKDNVEFVSCGKKQKTNAESQKNLSIFSFDNHIKSEQSANEPRISYTTQKSKEMMSMEKEKTLDKIGMSFENLEINPSKKDLIDGEESNEHGGKRIPSKKRLTWAPENEIYAKASKPRHSATYGSYFPSNKMLLYDIRKEVQLIPNIYKNQSFADEISKDFRNNALTLDMKEEKNLSNNLLISREMKKEIEDFSFKFSSLSISDQYLYEANKILNEFSLMKNEKNSNSSGISIEKSPFSVSNFLERKEEILGNSSLSIQDSFKGDFKDEYNENNEINEIKRKPVIKTNLIRNKLQEILAIDESNKEEEFGNEENYFFVKKPSMAQFSNMPSSIYCDLEKISPGMDSVMSPTLRRLCEFDEEDDKDKSNDPSPLKYGSVKIPMRTPIKSNIKKKSIKLN